MTCQSMMDISPRGNFVFVDAEKEILNKCGTSFHVDVNENQGDLHLVVHDQGSSCMWRICKLYERLHFSG